MTLSTLLADNPTTTDVDDMCRPTPMQSTDVDMRTKNMRCTMTEEAATTIDRKNQLLPCWIKDEDKHLTYTPLPFR